MDIQRMSMDYSQAKLVNEVSNSVMKLALDNYRESGQNEIEMMTKSMMEQSVNPSLGTNIDMNV